jgi:F-type H+-transporting ATPase subunit b
MRFESRTNPLALVLVLTALLLVVASAPVFGQQHAPASPAVQGGEPSHGRGAAAEKEAEHTEGVLPTIARLFNFALLAAALVYFLKSPIAVYLSSRATQIRQDLVAAKDLRERATAQLAEIDQKLKTLPAELDALKVRGAEDLKAERARIAQAAAAARERLLEQTRREIATRLRLARRELTEHAAQLAVQIAEQRIRRSITADDQLRMVDRYTTQLKEAR